MSSGQPIPLSSPRTSRGGDDIVDHEVRERSEMMARPAMVVLKGLLIIRSDCRTH